MDKLTAKQKKDFAHSLYMSERGITQREIATRAHVTEATLCRWVKDDSWDKQRKSLLVTRDEQLSTMYTQLEALNAAIGNRDEGKKYPTSKEADAVLKLASAIKKLETDTGIAQKVEVGKLFLVFLRGFDAQKAMDFMPLYDAFIKNSLR
ncbi:MAG: helix-turn-helix domain-containing protein [Mucinivorans sp.]